MIFQQFVRECCAGKPAEAGRLVENVTGVALGYQRLHRWYRYPQPMPVAAARLVVKASEGKCTLDELLDPELIAQAFKFEPSDAALERRFLQGRLAARERELRQLEQAQRLGRTLGDVQREVRQLRARLERLSEVSLPTAPRKRGRPAREPSSSAVPAAPRKRGRRPAAAAA